MYSAPEGRRCRTPGQGRGDVRHAAAGQGFHPWLFTAAPPGLKRIRDNAALQGLTPLAIHRRPSGAESPNVNQSRHRATRQPQSPSRLPGAIPIPTGGAADSRGRCPRIRHAARGPRRYSNLEDLLTLLLGTGRTSRRTTPRRCRACRRDPRRWPGSCPPASSSGGRPPSCRCHNIIAIVIGLIRGDGVAEVERRRRAGPAGVFPFRLRRQPVRLAVLLAQRLAEGHAVVPGDVLYRQIVHP